MPPRNRSQDLTADLLRDLAADETPGAPQPADRSPVSVEVAASIETSAQDASTQDAPTQDAPVPYFETTVYLAPSGWQWPGLSRTDDSVSASFGPVRFRMGRRTS